MEQEFDFDKEFLKVYPRLNNFSNRYNLSEEERQDLVSETTLKILEKRDMFQVKDKYKFHEFLGWCSRILHNTFINNYRKNKRCVIDSFDKEPLILYGHEPLFESSDVRIISTELLEEILRVESDTINRKIFFGFLNGYPYEALAEIFELPLGTIKSRLFNTRKKIKQALAKQA